MENKVLFVDDEISVLQGYRRILHLQFPVTTATGGEEGLSAIRTSGPFAVVVSDMRMPDMNGAQFLAKVRERAPDTVRILLTGFCDMDAAILAVNEGNIFRYLTKPCEKATLVTALRSAVDQYNAVLANHDLVRKAKLVRASLDWESHDMDQGRDAGGSAGLPGPEAARACLEELFAANRQGFVVLVKLAFLHLLEDRYGPQAVTEYVKSAIRVLAPTRGSKDRLFSWNRDVLMLVIRRPISPTAARIEITRSMQSAQDSILELNGNRVVVAAPSAFDLLPVSGFSSFDEMLAVFNAKLTGKL